MEWVLQSREDPVNVLLKSQESLVDVSVKSREGLAEVSSGSRGKWDKKSGKSVRKSEEHISTILYAHYKGRKLFKEAIAFGILQHT